ncbi:MAG: hypothetical protein AB8G11_20670 [Saprospiraceae bacterium]
MNITNTDKSIIKGYMMLFNNLSTNNKLDLIAQLTNLVKTDLNKKTSSFEKAFGALDTKETAEEMIEDIRSSRIFNRQIELF